MCKPQPPQVGDFDYFSSIPQFVPSGFLCFHPKEFSFLIFLELLVVCHTTLIFYLKLLILKLLVIRASHFVSH